MPTAKIAKFNHQKIKGITIRQY